MRVGDRSTNREANATFTVVVHKPDTWSSSKLSTRVIMERWFIIIIIIIIDGTADASMLDRRRGDPLTPGAAVVVPLAPTSATGVTITRFALDEVMGPVPSHPPPHVTLGSLPTRCSHGRPGIATPFPRLPLSPVSRRSPVHRCGRARFFGRCRGASTKKTPGVKGKL